MYLGKNLLPSGCPLPASALPDALVLFAQIVRDLGFLVYGGVIVATTLTASAAPWVGMGSPALVLGRFRSVGPLLGISMGAAFVGAVVAHYGSYGAFRWGFDPGVGGAAVAAAWLVFFALWVSNIRLEVWTLEPLRRLDPNGNGASPDAAALDRASRLVLRHLQLHSALVVGVVALARVASR